MHFFNGCKGDAMHDAHTQMLPMPMLMPRSILISLEGNIGAGKSTLLRELAALGEPDVVVVQEPVGLWCEPALPDGRSMLRSKQVLPTELSPSRTTLKVCTFVGGMSALLRCCNETFSSLELERNESGNTLVMRQPVGVRCQRRLQHDAGYHAA